MSQANVELVRRATDAIGRGDLEAFIAACDAGFEMHLAGVVGEPVHYKGADGVRQFVADMGESWASFAFEIEDARDLGDRVLIVGKQRGRGRSSGIDVESERAFIVELWHGRLISLRFFLQPNDALEAAGLAE